jgi:hypothetical protein
MTPPSVLPSGRAARRNDRRLRAPLSRPTLRLPTPIKTTALPFMLRVDPEGATEVGLIV